MVNGQLREPPFANNFHIESGNSLRPASANADSALRSAVHKKFPSYKEYKDNGYLFVGIL